MRDRNRAVATALASSVALLVASATASAMTLDEVIAKHTDARGGRAKWQAVQSIRMTGNFTAFSKTYPFTLSRARDDRYLLDHKLNGKTVIIGYDGDEAWWENHWFQPGAQPLTGVDLEAQRRDFDFVNPLFDYADHGYTAKLLGDVEYEGEPAIGIEIHRGEGPDGEPSVETWYLDPDTYLEMARISPGSDFGQPRPQRTVFDEFRAVDGLLIPHYIESQWYTRDRIMEVEKVELEVELDDDMFLMPAPPGMGVLRSMVGDWDVAVREMEQPGAKWKESQRSSTVTKQLNGGLLEERFEADGVAVIRTVSYDSFRERYRMTQIDGRTSLLDVLEGESDDAGKIVLDNMTTGTTLEMFGMTIHSRATIRDVTDGGFVIEVEASIDGGKNWWVASEATYAKKPPEQAAK